MIKITGSSKLWALIAIKINNDKIIDVNSSLETNLYKSKKTEISKFKKLAKLKNSTNTSKI